MNYSILILVDTIMTYPSNQQCTRHNLHRTLQVMLHVQFLDPWLWNVGPDVMPSRRKKSSRQLEQCSKPTSWLFDIGDYTTQLYWGLSKANIRIPINQSVFHVMSPQGFVSRCSTAQLRWIFSVGHLKNLPFLWGRSSSAKFFLKKSTCEDWKSSFRWTWKNFPRKNRWMDWCFFIITRKVTRHMFSCAFTTFEYLWCLYYVVLGHVRMPWPTG